MSSEVNNGSESSSRAQDGSRHTESKCEENANEDQLLSGPSGDEDMAPSKSKDPLWPKRKKARRACSPCQRAHLTCSDERPCERCVGRNRASECHDGHRKKAKYLHDTPDEVLEPGRRSQRGPVEAHPTSYVAPGAPIHPATFGPPMQHQSSMPSNYDQQTGMPIMVPVSQSAPSPDQVNAQGYPQQMFDPNEPSGMRFDVNGVDFINHYGALEFDMLGQMSTGIFNGAGSLAPSATSSFDQQQLPGDHMAYGYISDGSYSNWQTQRAMPYQPYNALNGPYRQRTQSGAYTINNGVFEAASPVSTETEAMNRSASGQDRKHSAPQYPVGTTSHQIKQEPLDDSSDSRPSEAISKRLSNARSPTRPPRRDPSTIYEEVKHPYPYTAAFHTLLAGVHRRFSAQRRVRIAQALASIRPSFISSTKDLTMPDLIFMEKCFQRGLWDLETDTEACPSPAVICRRTGEVAHANREFTILSGWEKDVLTGRKPNHNIAQHSPDESSSSSGGNTGRAGFNTPKLPPEGPNDAIRKETTNEGRPRHQKHQPVVLADLLDNESAVHFFEDYARLAYADRGSVIRHCQLLRYRTKEDGLTNIVGGASEDDKVECMYCLLVKRDVFNMPMMMVVNFLPMV